MSDLTAHEEGTLALVGVAKAALGALRLAVADLEIDPKAATRAVGEQATLLSKVVDSLAKRIDDLPDEHRASKTTADAGPTVHLPDVVEALARLRSALQNGSCRACGGLQAAVDTRLPDGL